MTNNRVGYGDGTIQSTGELLAGAKGELRRLSRELQSEIDQLQGKWGGAGAQAFGVLNRTWDEKQRAIVMTLEKFEATLDETEKSMTTTDEESSFSVVAIRNQMEGI